jgi:hypothetical protein
MEGEKVRTTRQFLGTFRVGLALRNNTNQAEKGEATMPIGDHPVRKSRKSMASRVENVKLERGHGVANRGVRPMS